MFYGVLPLGFQLSCGKSVKYRFIEFFVSDYSSLPYLLSLFFWSGVALDKISESNSFSHTKLLFEVLYFHFQISLLSLWHQRAESQHPQIDLSEASWQGETRLSHFLHKTSLLNIFGLSSSRGAHSYDGCDKVSTVNTFPGPGARGIFHPQGEPGLSAGLTEEFIISLYFLSYYSC